MQRPYIHRKERVIRKIIQKREVGIAHDLIAAAALRAPALSWSTPSFGEATLPQWVAHRIYRPHLLPHLPRFIVCLTLPPHAFEKQGKLWFGSTRNRQYSPPEQVLLKPDPADGWVQKSLRFSAWLTNELTTELKNERLESDSG